MTSRTHRTARETGARPTRRRLSSWPVVTMLGAALLTVGLQPRPGPADAASPSVQQRSGTAAGGRGTPLWVTPIRTLDVGRARSYLRHSEFSAADVRYGVRLYRIVYRTIDAHRRATTASGLLVLPTRRKGTLATVSFAHGTTSYRSDAPSSMPEDGFASAPAVVYAAAGYAAVAPDYLGLGVGPGPHPWFHVPSETSASLDLLRAARTFTAHRRTRVGSDVLVTGFSQGASAALGLAHALERGAAPRFRLRGAAPISGAYAFASVDLPAALDGRIAGPVAVPYIADLLVSYDRVYGLYRDPSAYFRRPYAARVATLFDGNVPGEDMIRELPSSLPKLLTRRGLAALRHPSGRLAAGLRTADAVCTTRLGVPVRLDYARGDEQAINPNTTECLAAMRRAGTRVGLHDLGTPEYAGSRHLGSAVSGVTDTLRWFEHVRRPGR